MELYPPLPIYVAQSALLHSPAQANTRGSEAQQAAATPNSTAHSPPLRFLLPPALHLAPPAAVNFATALRRRRPLLPRIQEPPRACQVQGHTVNIQDLQTPAS
ncbi:unnamed protein product [Urochloa humidicola]